MKDYKVLAASLALAYIDHPVHQVDVPSAEKPGLRRSHAGAEEQAEEYGKGDHIQPRCQGSSGYMRVASAEQVVKLLVREVVGYVLVPLTFASDYRDCSIFMK
jgi:hypothetical protein